MLKERTRRVRPAGDGVGAKAPDKAAGAGDEASASEEALEDAGAEAPGALPPARLALSAAEAEADADAVSKTVAEADADIDADADAVSKAVAEADIDANAEAEAISDAETEGAVEVGAGAGVALRPRKRPSRKRPSGPGREHDTHSAMPNSNATAFIIGC